ncbi:WD repeat-containing protein 76 [Asparagus officinalis]|uniref:WD repeat-containing protein 76 n=1 Tax=Asparagus officinalis TaxID=4686 RepID=UPI00098E500C|nr:WD repeat-containing protein 76 [Asparagus officinalis]
MSAMLGSKAGLGQVRGEGFDPRSELGLKPKGSAKVVSERIMSVRFLPFVDRTVVVVGNKIGNLGFWDLDFGEGDGGGIYVYHPHSGPVSGISVHPFSPRKIFTSSYDGFVRLMDVEKGSFNMLTSSDDAFFSICQWPEDVNSLYIGEGGGMLKVLDEREGKDSNFWQLHEGRINTVDFNPENPHLMATSSSDGLACIWDLRSMKKDKPDVINSVGHGRAVHAAYFSPSGKFLATTSLDDKVGIASGTDYGELSMVSHYNQTGRWLSAFRAIWGWDDSYVFVGNMKRAIDVISTANNTTTSLDSPDIMTSIPCRFAAHPYKPGHLAGATSGGKVFLWTKES